MDKVCWLKVAGLLLALVGTGLVGYVLYLTDPSPRKHKKLEVK